MFLAIKFSLSALVCGATLSAASSPLRVCADPGDLPYSNRQQQGFENKLAELIAKDLGKEVTYTWYPQRGKFFRKTLAAGVCDIVMSVPEGMKDEAVTQPYYRSSYVFVTRRDRHLQIQSLDDPRLRNLRIGVHVLGEPGNHLPPVQALISRGIVTNLVGYSIFGNLNETNPAANLIAAVSHQDVDIAVAWGPLASYFARGSNPPLEVTPIHQDPANPALPLSFDIGIGVRLSDEPLRRQLEAELKLREPQIRELLRSYGITRSEE